MVSPYKPVIQTLTDLNDYRVDVLRLDLVDPETGGNKWFKLKYNLQKAKEQKHSRILTFGGAYSNHIAATAAAASRFGLKSTGIIRGEPGTGLNPTLKKAQEYGMTFHFVDRNTYREKEKIDFLENLKSHYGDFYLIPEGGSNREGFLGCTEIFQPGWNYDYVCCACGTGTTYAGILASVPANTIVLGFSVLKGKNTMPLQVSEMLTGKGYQAEIHGNEALEEKTIRHNTISNSYCFSGYGKFDKELLNFKRAFEEKHDVPLDYIYTSKLFFSVIDLARQKKFAAGSCILIIHSGGLQGNKGFEERFKL